MLDTPDAPTAELRMVAPRRPTAPEAPSAENKPRSRPQRTTFDEDFARCFADRLGREDPDPRFRRARTLSRRELVAATYEMLMAKRRAGYPYEVIADQCTQLGVPISTSTLRTYMQRHARRLRADAATAGRKNPQQGTSPLRGNARPPRTTSAPIAERGSRRTKVAAPDVATPDADALARAIAATQPESQTNSDLAIEHARAPTPDVLAEAAGTAEQAAPRLSDTANSTAVTTEQHHALDAALSDADDASARTGSDLPGEVAATNHEVPSASAPPPGTRDNSGGASPSLKAYRSAIAIRPEKPLSAFKDKPK